MPGRNTHRSGVRNLEKAATVQIEYIIWPQWKYISLECACFQLLNCMNEMAPSLTLWEDSTRFFEHPIFPATWRQPVIREKEPPLGYHIFAIDDRHEICFCGKGRALFRLLARETSFETYIQSPYTVIFAGAGAVQCSTVRFLFSFGYTSSMWNILWLLQSFWMGFSQ